MNQPLPRILGAGAAIVALAGYGLMLFAFPEVLDWAFDQGGKAPMLVAVVGAAITMGAYVAVEKIVSKVQQG